jgi:hypothetical protein
MPPFAIHLVATPSEQIDLWIYVMLSSKGRRASLPQNGQLAFCRNVTRCDNIFQWNQESGHLRIYD